MSHGRHGERPDVVAGLIMSHDGKPAAGRRIREEIADLVDDALALAERLPGHVGRIRLRDGSREIEIEWVQHTTEAVVQSRVTDGVHSPAWAPEADMSSAQTVDEAKDLHRGRHRRHDPDFAPTPVGTLSSIGEAGARRRPGR